MVVTCAGIDLASREDKPSGVSVVKVTEGLDLDLVLVSKALRDNDIVKFVLGYGVKAVAIDAPLSLPMTGYYRQLDLELKRRGFNVLPPSWRYMRELTLRAIKLAEAFTSLGVAVLETHPSSCLKSSGCYSFEALTSTLRIRVPSRISKDEEDSIIAAIVCAFHVQGKSVVVHSKDGSIVLLPRVC